MQPGDFWRSKRLAKVNLKEGLALSSSYLASSNPLSTVYLVRDHHAVSIALVGSSQGAVIPLDELNAPWQ
jgi:hypothetical protein